MPASQEAQLTSDLLSDVGFRFNANLDAILVSMVCMHPQNVNPEDILEDCRLVEYLIHSTSLLIGPNHFTVSILKQYRLSASTYVILNTLPFSIAARYDSTMYGGVLAALTFGGKAMALTMFPNRTGVGNQTWLGSSTDEDN